MSDRIERLKAKMSLSAKQCLLVSSEKNRFYLTGFNSSKGLLLITEQKSILLMDFRYFESAKSKVRSAEVVLCDYFDDFLLAFLAENKITDVFTESRGISLFYARHLETVVGKKGDISLISNNSLDYAIFSLRALKSEKEIDSICTAQEISEYALKKAMEKLSAGMSEKELSLDIEFLMRKNGAECVSFDLITIFGENTSLPHGVPTERKLKKGDMITCDIGAMYNGYCSDMTRTFAYGSITEEQRKIYNIVLTAQNKAIAKVRPGIKCSDIDKEARDIIDNSGYKDCFGHSTGHSLGLDIHESPAFSPYDDTILEPGMVLTIEPGIYIEGNFGVRIEDMLLVTDTGSKNLTHMEKELLII